MESPIGTGPKVLEGSLQTCVRYFPVLLVFNALEQVLAVWSC